MKKNKKIKKKFDWTKWFADTGILEQKEQVELLASLQFQELKLDIPKLKLAQTREANPLKRG